MNGMRYVVGGGGELSRINFPGSDRLTTYRENFIQKYTNKGKFQKKTKLI